MKTASEVQKKRESNSEVLPYLAPRSATEKSHGFAKDSHQSFLQTWHGVSRLRYLSLLELEGSMRLGTVCEYTGRLKPVPRNRLESKLELNTII